MNAFSMKARFPVMALLLLSLCACQPTSSLGFPLAATPTPQVTIQGDNAGREEIQTIEIDNCDGKGDAIRTEQRSQSVEVTISPEIAARLGASIEVITAEIQATVGASTTRGTTRSTSIQLSAPPQTRMVFQLIWTGKEQIGVVQNLRGSSIPIAFSGFTPTDVRIKSQADTGCSGSEESTDVRPVAVQPQQPTPRPSNTPMPTRRPTETPLPPPTLVPDTQPDTILEVGQTWRQGEMELVLVQANLRAGIGDQGDIGGWYTDDEYWPKGIERGGVDVMFRLTSHKAQEVVVRYTLKSVSAIDNLGNKLTVFCWGDAGFPDSWYNGALPCKTFDEMLSPGQTIDLLGLTNRGDGEPWITAIADVADPSLREIVVEVSGIAGIENARWRIPIPH